MTYDWKWYAGSDDEIYEFGPFDTREDAIVEAKAYEVNPIYVVEAKKSDYKISRFCGFNLILDKIDDNFYDTVSVCEDDEPPYFTITGDQEMELIDLLTKCVDAWQEKHQIKCNTITFSNARNYETIEVDYDTDMVE